MLYAIAKVSDGEYLVGYRILDSVSKKASNYTHKYIKNKLIDKNIEIYNLREQDGEIVISDSSAFYPVIDKTNKTIKKQRLVALKRKSYYMYEVADYTGNIFEIDRSEFKYKAFNGKLVNHRDIFDMDYGISSEKAEVLQGKLDRYKSKEALLGVCALDIEIVGDEAILYEIIDESSARCIIPSFITVIDESAFARSNIASISIPESVKYIGTLAFNECTKLTDLTMENTEIVLGREIFSSCDSLKNVKLSNKLKKIPEKIFYYCESLRDLDIPMSVQEIGVCAFEGCSKLTNLNIRGKIDKVGIRAFEGCGLTEIDLNHTKEIGPGAFKNCSSLRNINLGCIKVISSYLFEGCTSLYSIEIPEGVEEIMDGAFIYCENLEKIILPRTLKTIYADAFEDISDSTKIYIPNDLVGIIDEDSYNVIVYR